MVSTQAGCAMACGFCATGQAGFAVSSPAARSSSRWSWPSGRPGPDGCPTSSSWAWASPWPTTTGLWAAIERLHDPIGLSARHLTVSTVASSPASPSGRRELPVNLAVSLHAANDECETDSCPSTVATRWPLWSRACEIYRAAKGRRLSLEWALIDGVNDRRSDAVELAAIAGRSGPTST